jgi:hypothetical protein
VNLVTATLPLDDHRRSASLIGVAFADRAPFDPTIAASLRDWDRELRRRLEMLVGRAKSEGELRQAIDGEHLVRGVLAFAAGFASQLLYDPMDEPKARAVVETMVRALTA